MSYIKYIHNIFEDLIIHHIYEPCIKPYIKWLHNIFIQYVLLKMCIHIICMPIGWKHKDKYYIKIRYLFQYIILNVNLLHKWVLHKNPYVKCKHIICVSRMKSHDKYYIYKNNDLIVALKWLTVSCLSKPSSKL